MPPAFRLQPLAQRPAALGTLHLALTTCAFACLQRVRFISEDKPQQAQAPYYRHPISFPDITLQLLRPSDQMLDEIKQYGWTREATFKTTPEVTKVCAGDSREATGASLDRRRHGCSL